MVAGSTAHSPERHLRVPLQRLPSSKSSQSSSVEQPHMLSPPLQTPSRQRSPTVQVLPSEQLPVMGDRAHSPVFGSQVLLRQGSSRLVSHTTSSTWVSSHSPATQVICSNLHRLSLDATGQSASVWQGQPPAVPPHFPLAQTSSCVHSLPSSHTALLAENRQPAAGSQLSSVHELPSSHNWRMPPPHAPSRQNVSAVHELSSSHGV